MDRTVARRWGLGARVAGNLLLLPTMCSAGVGTWAETWILDQADECLGAWRDANDDDPRGRYDRLASLDHGERWHSRHEADFRVELPVADPDSQTARWQELWLRCEAHQGEGDATVIDSVELLP